jgi:hypothetical protein
MKDLLISSSVMLLAAFAFVIVALMFGIIDRDTTLTMIWKVGVVVLAINGAGIGILKIIGRK